MVAPRLAANMPVKYATRLPPAQPAVLEVVDHFDNLSLHGGSFADFEILSRSGSICLSQADLFKRKVFVRTCFRASFFLLLFSPSFLILNFYFLLLSDRVRSLIRSVNEFGPCR